METRPSPAWKLRRLRTLQLAFMPLALLRCAGPPVSQVVPDASLEIGAAAPDRDQKSCDLRQVIDRLETDHWRQLADVVVELIPNDDGTIRLKHLELPRPKLLNVPSPGPKAPNAPAKGGALAWRWPDGSHLFFRVDFYGRVQEVDCEVPEPLRQQPLTFGLFQVAEDEVECFARAVP